ncbi:nuclease-related domain-containing protein [Acinetobacter sp. ANC 4178]|uniref:nuclease-related domain-containing protein n=1 Tax=Acinetobacter sp. ANC 4178 TaxID=2529839 RepID=UPI00103E6AEC|nr:nuclease-related domain-containing protein [Acinetobacter sp. ANC 4178]TCB67903.1 NERD domain-containing protein [Acinetobacter sp. ANC 4178]
MISQIFAPLLSTFWWILLLFIVIGIIKAFKPYLKGKMGEFAVAAHAKLYLDQDRYTLLNDCTLPDEQNQTTQIDHILLSPFGIFVIETKNYKGWIFGSQHQKMWTQKIYKKSFKFQNPLHQNYKHQKVLEAVLSDIVEPQFIHSLVVFMPDCEFKTQMPQHVFRGAGWTDYVKNFQEVTIPPMKLKRIQLRIEKEVLEKSWKTNRQHIENLKLKHSE